MLKEKVKKRIFTGLKIILSLAAISYVLTRINPLEIFAIFNSANKIMIFSAFLAFIASKIMSAYRSMIIIDGYNIPLSALDNLKLYWTGMFYNQLLPGGVGGDIYKTIVINKLHKNGFKISAGTVLIDRLAGVTVLIILGLSCLPFTDLNLKNNWIVFSGIPLVLSVFIVLIFIFLPVLKNQIPKLLGLSLLVQSFQIVSILLIIYATGINFRIFEYILIFLVSSIAAMLPLSIGGIGIRELVFLKGSEFLLTDQETAVTISLIFYLISAISSLPGAFINISRGEELKPGFGSDFSAQKT